MKKIGVVEGFFGPQWPLEERKSYAQFLSLHGGDFYIYAPKQDPFLRKQWREEWDAEYKNKISNLIETFHAENIHFGVGFSPFGLGETLSEEDKHHLHQKLQILNELNIDMLGLFFDDMPTNENLAKTQIEALEHIQKVFKKKIIFCPSYYTPDPILDKVFGQRPPRYLEEIAQGLTPDVSIAWTGPKVISPEINEAHLKEVSILLKRKPFIWENFFANDGPRNCKFLKLKPFTGRDQSAFLETEAFGLNLMNQPELSKIVFLSSLETLKGKPSSEAFTYALERLCSSELVYFIESNKILFNELGLDQISEEKKQELLNKLSGFNEPAAKEIKDWLSGGYLVGSECLTD